MRPMRKVDTQAMTLVEIFTVSGRIRRVWNLKLECGHSAAHPIYSKGRVTVMLPPTSKRCVACPAVLRRKGG